MSDKITHALISVSDKDGIIDFAKGLADANITILSTGGTANLLREHQICVQDIANFTGFPEMMDGRVKTLHPRLYGGILARGAQDMPTLTQYNIPMIGLVVVNLYPFEETISQANCHLEEAIENIDIGGPTLLRAAAKNYQHTTAVIDKRDYHLVLTQIAQHGHTLKETRFNLARKVFAQIANYDAVVSHYFATFAYDEEVPGFPDAYALPLNKKIDLRYGENPHQQAAFYITHPQQKGPTISNAVQQSGKRLSYNNIADANAALECVKQFNETACVIVKHANPCAVSLDNIQREAYQKAFNADSTSAFGGIIAFNSTLESSTLKTILAQQFAEVIIAPDISSQALKIAKLKSNLRVLTVGSLSIPPSRSLEYKSVSGGMLIQEKDNLPTPGELAVVTKRHPRDQELEDLLFAWQVVRFVKSNAIVLARNKSTLGIGPGQMSRVFSSKIASLKANEAALPLKGAIMASDAFFPFRDSIDEAARLGITAIIQPGGSIRDQEVIDAANEHQLAMVFTHRRHFRH